MCEILKDVHKFFLNYQNKVGISVNPFSPLGSFVIFIITTHKFSKECYLTSYLKN